MLPVIRPATLRDLSQIAALLAEDADQRRSLDPELWRVAADGQNRLRSGVQAVLQGSATAVREFFLVAEHAGAIVGVAHAMLVPVPPIYDVPGSPGLVLDDCFTSSTAPTGTAEALLVATEATLRTEGAPSLIASCAASAPLRPLYERYGYEPVTLFMVKHGFSPGAQPPSVRPAGADDVASIVQLSADHRRTLAVLNPRFWRIHPDADGRFGQWMRHSLTLADRNMFVADGPAETQGYVIAQPCSPLLVPRMHDVAAIGAIDDFYDQDFANVSMVANGGSSGEALLSAAESAFAHRRINSALVVCPTAWPSKISLLEHKGYRTAKLWMLKR
jgi:hypothetical protein